MYTDLPIELLIYLYSFLSPEQAILATRVTKRTKTALTASTFMNDNLWKLKFIKHFPHLYPAVSQQNQVNWYVEFFKAYWIEYKDLPKKIRKIFSFVKEQDLESLKAAKLNLSKEDLNYYDINELSPIEWAQRIGNQDILDYFFQVTSRYYVDETGLYPKKVDARGWTILHFATHCHQSVHTIESLLLQGCEVNKLTRNGFRPLTSAVLEDQEEIVLLLLSYGAQIDAISHNGATALLIAAEHNRKNIVNILLNNDANTQLALLVTNKYHNKFGIIPGDTPFHVATRLGHEEIVNAFLDRGTPVDIRNAHNATPLMLAAQAGQAGVAALLIRCGAAIDARSAKGATPLLFSVEHGHKNVADMLLEHGANTELALLEENEYHTRLGVYPGDKPLHVAVKLGRIDFIEALLAKGANINASNTCCTPLMLTMFSGHDRADIAEFLIKHQANINARTPSGATALMLSIEVNAYGVFTMLLQNNADISIPVTVKAEVLIAGDTPLHAAARLNREMMVKALLLKDANYEARNSKQEEPWHVAPSGASYLAELKLLSYTAKMDRVPDDHRKSFSLFGHEFFKFGCPAKPIKNALNALKKVVYEGADASSLNPHKEVLNSGDIQSIYQGFRLS